MREKERGSMRPLRKQVRRTGQALDTRLQATATTVEEFAAILEVGQLSDVASVVHWQLSTLETLHPTFPSDGTSLALLNAINKMQLQSIFGKVCIALRSFCTLPITVAAGEKVFSKLKQIKSYLRSTMSQERLNNLAILSVENKLALWLD